MLRQTSWLARCAAGALLAVVLPTSASFGTSVTPASARTAEAGGPAVVGSPVCGLPGAVFCETFDAPAGDPATRSGDLDPVLWGVSRVNTMFNFTQGELNNWLDTTLMGCGADQVVNAPRDVQVCNGRLYESVTDGHNQSTLAMYPKQPFDIAGNRAGTVVFDTSADSEGGHAAWQEFWWTDQPLPVPHGHLPSNHTVARNSFGFDLDGQCTGDVAAQQGDHQPYVGVNGMQITTNYALSDVALTRVGCVKKGSLTNLNHFEVRFNVNGHTAEVWGSDPGGANLHMLAYTTTPLPLTRGVIWIEDLHYNANKFDSQGTHTFAWDNVGFDGPAPYRDLTFDVQDAHTPCASAGCQQLGYYVDQAPRSFTVNGVNWLQTPSTAYVAFTWTPSDPAVPEVRVNGGAWQTLPFPSTEVFAARSIAIPVPMSDIIAGANTVQMRYHNDRPKTSDGGTVVSNLNIILIAAAPALPPKGAGTPTVTPVNGFGALVPARLFDSRPDGQTVDGIGQQSGLSRVGSITNVPVLGRGGVGAGASTVLVNVIATEPVAAGYLTVYPCGDGQPLASSLNFSAGETVSNAVISKVGAGGSICIFTSQPTHLVVDVNGFVTPAAGLTSIVPQRLMDTRPGGVTADGVAAGAGALGLGTVTELNVGSRAGVPASSSAVALDVVATGSVGAGYLTVYPCGSDRPLASTVNFASGETRANLALTRTSATGSVCIYASQSTHVVVDVAGFGAPGATYRPLQPARVYETRSNEGSTIDGQYAAVGRRDAGTVTEIVIGGRAGVPSTATAVVLNVTIVDPVAPGFATVFPCGVNQPLASNLNFVTHQTVANLVVSTLGTSGRVCLVTSQTADIVVDVGGYFAAS